MCKILTIINTKDSNNKILQDIITANVDDLKSERCGYSVLRHNKADYYLGDNDYKNFANNVKYNGEKVFAIHARTATGGDRDKKGLHLQKRAGWFWAHNGIVSGFSSVKDYSDSYYFFMSLISQARLDKVNNPFPKEIIEKACTDFGFNGKGLMYNPQSDVLQWFCNQASYVYLLDGCIIITTYELSLTIEEYTMASILGFEWITETKTTEIPIIHKEKIDDCLLTFYKSELIQRVDVKLRSYTYTGGGYNPNLPTQTRIIVPGTTNTPTGDGYQYLSKRERKKLKRWEKIMAEADAEEKKQKQNGLYDPETGDYKIRLHEME